MPALFKSLVLRAIAAVAFVLPLSTDIQTHAASDHAHPGHDEEAGHKEKDSSKMTAKSSFYEVFGQINSGVLTLHLHRLPEGTSVTGANIGLSIDGESGTATGKGDGRYVYRSAALRSEKAQREVVITVQDGKRHDLLVGTLAADQPDSKESHAGHDHDDHSEKSAHSPGHEGHAEKSDGGHKHDDHSAENHAHNGSGHRNGTKGGRKHDDHDSKEHAHGHEGHGGEGHGDDHSVKLTAAVMREFGVKTERANRGAIAKTITRPAEVSYNLDYFTHVVPRVAGIAKSIKASQGDQVEAGQVLAVIESRELAELKAAYLAAIERFDLAKQEYRRLQALRKKRIASEKSYLTARSVFVEARIAMRSARQKLSSIGISQKILKQIVKKPDANLTRYHMRSPMGGTVISRHLVKGELVSNQREAFVIADLSSVWVDVSVYASDIPLVRAGQKVILETETGQVAEASITFVTPDVSETTRTAKARVVLNGKSSSFRPGMFIKARVAVSETDVAVRVPTSALHVQESDTVIFTGENGVFKPRPVKVGRKNGHFAEIIEGLRPGETFATEGSFIIKAQLSKASFGDGHNH